MEPQEKILLIDIETSPNISYTWGTYEQNVIEFVKPWHILSFSARWLKGEHITKGLPDYREYHTDKESDKALVKEIWHLLDRAEIVIGHNHDAFDLKKISARLAYWDMPPPSPYRTVDTKKIAKRYFGFNTNKLDDLGQFLKLGRKMKHEGFELWTGCMAGDPKAWKTMLAYNKQDVILLEKLYLKLRPWIKTHPNMGIYENATVCPKCGSKNLQKRGTQFNQTTSYQRILCNNCHGWSRTPLKINENKPLTGL